MGFRVRVRLGLGVGVGIELGIGLGLGDAYLVVLFISPPFFCCSKLPLNRKVMEY